jgi:hypothetical protein
MGNYEISRDGDLWVLRSLCPPRRLFAYEHWSDAFVDLAILNDETPIRSDDRSPRTSSADHR